MLTIRLSDIDEEKIKKEFEQYKTEYIDDLSTVSVNVKFNSKKNVS